MRFAAALVAVVLLACHSSRPTAATLEDISRAKTGDERVDAIARKCARIASCAHRHDAPLFRDPATCVEFWLEHLEDTAEPVPPCLSTVATCGDVEACLHGSGDARAAAYCAAHPGVATACDGDALVTCAKDDPNESVRTECASLGAACGETHAAGGLVTRGCLSTSACAADVTRARCDGPGSIIACHDQVLERIPCGPGATCRAHVDDDGEELATCEAPAEVPCDAIGRRACRGGTLVRCEAHGHHGREESVDCAALGLACGDVVGRAACTAGEAACATGAPRCERDELVFCAAGRTERVACRDIGLGPCETEGKGPVALCGAGRQRAPRW